MNITGSHWFGSLFLTTINNNLKQSIMSVLLEDCKEITTTQYCELPGTPEFIGQSKIDNNNMYWMISKSEDVLYKTHHKL